MSDRWWWWPLPSSQYTRPVLFFPPAGADQTVARPLIESGAGMRLGVLRLPGRGSRQDEEGPVALAPLVREVADSVEALPGPAPVLVGHSFGGLLAYAVALELSRRGAEPALLMVVATTAPHRWLPNPDEDRVDFARRRTEKVMRIWGMPGLGPADGALVERVTQQVQADLTLATELVTDQLACRVCVVTPLEDLASGAVDPSGWQDLSSGETEQVTVPGGHFFYRDRPALLTTRMRMECALLDDAFEVA